MLLGFQDRFVPLVREGSKTHTIRAGARWKAGMRGDLFEKTRQPKMFAYEVPPGCTCLRTSAGLCFLSGVRVTSEALIPKRWQCGAAEHAHLKEPIEQVAGMRLIFHAPIVRVESIQIVSYRQMDALLVPGLNVAVYIEGTVLSPDETEAFFRRDGFRGAGASAVEQAWLFWRQRLPFHGQIIHWNYDQRSMEKDNPKR